MYKLHTHWTCIICSLQNIPPENLGHHEMCLKDLHIIPFNHFVYRKLNASGMLHLYYIDTHTSWIWNLTWLTHLPLDKMTTILQTTFSSAFSWNIRILIQFSPKFVPKCPIDNKSALVQVMACRPSGAKPLPEPMLTQFTYAYMWHWGKWVK